MNLDAQLDKVLYRYDELRELLSSADGSSFAKLSKEFSEIEPVVGAVQALKKARSDMEEAEIMMADPEMKDLAEAERLLARLFGLPVDAPEDKRKR